MFDLPYVVFCINYWTCSSSYIYDFIKIRSKSRRTNQAFKICYDIACKRSYIFTPMSNLLQCKIQYFRKCGSTFNIRLNSDRKDAKSEKPILSSKYFNEPNSIFEQHAQFTLIEQIRKQKATKETKKFFKKEKTSTFYS